MSNEKPRLPAPVQRAVTSARRPFEKISKQAGGLVMWERESMFALQALSSNTLLQKCDPTTIRNSVVNIASIGLSLNPVLQYCALVPRYNKQLEQYECHCDPMYRGLIAIATEDDTISNVWADVVREKDRDDGNFKYFSGTEPRVIHNPDPFMTEEQRGPVIGAYCIAEIPGSAHPHVTFMSKTQIDEVRDHSEFWKKKKKGPWKDWYEEMAKKSVIKRAQKTWPKGTGIGRMDKAVQLTHVADGYAPMDAGTVEPEPEELITEEEAKELRAAARKAHLRVEKIYKAFDIERMEQLPKNKLTACQKRINLAGLHHLLKHAENKDTIVSAKAWGVSYRTLEGIGAEYETKATLTK